MHFKVRKRAILAPQENGPEKSIKWSEKCRFGAFKCTFWVFSDHLIDSCGGRDGIFLTLKNELAHPESKKKSSEAHSGSIHPYGRYGNAVKTRKVISTIAILWPVKAIFEKRAATVEVDTLISPAFSNSRFWGSVWGGDNHKVSRIPFGVSSRSSPFMKSTRATDRQSIALNSAYLEDRDLRNARPATGIQDPETRNSLEKNSKITPPGPRPQIP